VVSLTKVSSSIISDHKATIQSVLLANYCNLHPRLCNLTADFDTQDFLLLLHDLCSLFRCKPHFFQLFSHFFLQLSSRPFSTTRLCQPLSSESPSAFSAFRNRGFKAYRQLNMMNPCGFTTLLPPDQDATFPNSMRAFSDMPPIPYPSGLVPQGSTLHGL
jgi:hypothetical protein